MADTHDLIFKGKRFVKAVETFSKSDIVKYGQLVKTELLLDRSMYKSALKVESDPKKAIIVVLASVIQKAMAAAGLETKAETQACLEAVANISADFTSAAVLAPETVGLGAILPLLFAAVDSYDVGRSCFVVDSVATHAVVAKARGTVERGMAIKDYVSKQRQRF